MTDDKESTQNTDVEAGSALYDFDDLIAHRKDFPALDQFIWFDNGVVSITPLPVAHEYMDRIEEVTRRGPAHVCFPAEEYPRRSASRQRIAGFIGAHEQDIAFVRGVSEGYRTVLCGLDWKPGDHLIISSDEEAALLLPSLYLRDTVGVDLTFLPAGRTDDEIMETLESSMTDRTRLIATSHVTTNLGARMPVEQICSRARERGILSFVDVAHSIGLSPLTVADIGADFLGMVSYKWLFGPYAVGILWTDPSAVSQINLRYAGNRSEVFLNEATLEYELRSSGQRFEFGPGTWPVIHAWATAVDYVDALNTTIIWERTNTLASQLKTELAGIDGVHVVTPFEPQRSAALVAFQIDGTDNELVSSQLRERDNIRMKFVPKYQGTLRASISFFTLEEEINSLVAAVARIAGQR